MLLMLLMLLFTVSFHSFAFNSDYTIGAGDKIQISVYGEQDLSIDELYIDNSGKFDYPYLGQLSALNKTTEQLKDEIIVGLKGDYLISPKVRVSIIGFRSIYVNGEVKKPGGYEYQPGLTVDKAIALAGGFTDRASRSKVYIAQAGKDELKDKVKLSATVSPGDIIVIEQSFF
ncbi:polysaccharide biosynthesis/export family protein [Vibrio sp. PNB22_4_1]|uniref:polysaccharide biosynthesis/export family protein n=1 Tax=unclassified Vibrio TaxID=2614977 RepID=UPI00406A1AF2